MSFRTSVTIVASPRRRVGKTLAARLLTGFHLQAGRAPAAFDLNEDVNRLAEFLPERAIKASIADTRGQMALFDALVGADERPKIVDLAADKLDAFFALAERFCFVEEARARGIAPAAMFVLTPDQTSVEAYLGLRRRFPRLLLAPLHNEMFGPTPPREKYGLGSTEPVLRLPMLATALRRTVDTPPYSFAAVPSIAGGSRAGDTEAEISRWLRRIFLEFRELDLRLLLSELTSSIHFGG